MFLELTDCKSKTKIYINVDCISVIQEQKGRYLEVILTNNSSYTVEETMEEIRSKLTSAV